VNRNHQQGIKRAKEAATHCFYCGTHFSNVTSVHQPIKTVDHFVPLFLGGTNMGRNKVICCYRCNHFKGNFDPNGWAAEIERVLAGAKLKHRRFFTNSKLHHILNQITYLMTTSNVASSGFSICNHEEEGDIRTEGTRSCCTNTG
jgi:hypothetical protein